VLIRVFEEGAWADRALHGEARRLGLDARERALATRLAYGCVQRRATLDHVLEILAGRPVERLEPVVRAALRLGIYQLVFADRVPAHAAVGESVELVKRRSPGGAKLVNAVLRRAAREAPALVASLPDATPAETALKHSYPEWIAELWWEALGPGEARALMAAGNEPAEAALRVNTLRADPAELAARLPVATRPAPGLPEGLLLDGPFDAFASPDWERGAFMPQSRAAMTVARLLAPRPGERVLDLCAAPGGKSAMFSRAVRPGGFVISCDTRPRRLKVLQETLHRENLPRRVVRIDATEPLPFAAAFDRVVVDAPCSGLGTLRRDPDVKWSRDEASLARFAVIQRSLLDRASEAVRPGGSLVYATCSSEPEENGDVVTAFLAAHPEYELQTPMISTRPDRDALDAFFVAVLVRRESA
jgi:16S rRNA (cytosine967-C5)-methyltransferase